MPNFPKNMQRLKRGELSRIKPQISQHTDVYQPAPGVRQAETIQVDKDAGARRKLEEAEALLRETRGALEDAGKEINALKASLKEAQEAASAVQERPEPAVGVHVKQIAQIKRKKDRVRLSCVTKPTEGPVGEELAIYLSLAEARSLVESKELADDEEG